MDKEVAAQSLTDTMAKFTAYIGKRLPKDVTAGRPAHDGNEPSGETHL